MKQKKLSPVFCSIQATQINKSEGVINGIVIAQKGQTKNDTHLDDVFLSQLVLLGNSQGQGVKARNGHPNMCDSSLGAYIGRYKNFRTSIVNNKSVVLADLYLDDTSKISPKGNSFDYIIQMAEKNPDTFGNSIVYSAGEPNIIATSDSNGQATSIAYERAESFIASDIVDSPAATDSLFNSHTDLAAISTEFLEENPQIFELLDNKPQVLNEFLTKFKMYQENKKR